MSALESESSCPITYLLCDLDYSFITTSMGLITLSASQVVVCTCKLLKVAAGTP
jgi:hypothetical protein